MNDHEPRRGALLALVLAVALGAPARPAVGAPSRGPAGPGPTATADPAPGLCTVTGEETLDAARIEVGQTVGVSLRLSASCPTEARGRADILLVLDHSASMLEEGKHDALKVAVHQFVEGVDFARHRVGLVHFSDSAYVAQPLTDNRERLLRALELGGRPQGGTNIASAIEVADDELEVAGRTIAVDVIVLLTDGQSVRQTMIDAAAAARRRGTVIFTVGLGPDAEQDALREIATSSAHFSYAPGPSELSAIYARISAMIHEFTVTDVAFFAQLGPGVGYVAGSGAPGEPSGTWPLDWRLAFLSGEPATVTFRAQVGRSGRVRPVESAWAEYTDGDGVRRRFNFAPAELEVVVPIRRSIYLPVTWRNQCLPSTRWADVALALDVSNSMQGEKLAQAVDAAKRFVRLLDLPAVRAAVIGYDADAHLLQPLTGNRAALESVLDGIRLGSGTRIDRGIEGATAELLGPRRNADNRPVLVLLSDGVQVDEPGRVRPAAEFARSVGITIFTIALGQDADRRLLQDVAGSSERAYFSPGAAGLAQIYAEVAGVVGCR